MQIQARQLLCLFGSVRNRGKSCRLSDANSMTHVRARTPAEIRHLATRAAFPQRRSSNANTLYGQNSAGFLQICKTFKGIICDDISEFESYMPSQISDLAESESELAAARVAIRVVCANKSNG